MKTAITKVILSAIVILGLSGCTVRTYSVTKPRVDQQVSGNKGYLKGSAPSTESKAKSDKRETYVVEFEFGSPFKIGEPESEPRGPVDVKLPDELQYVPPVAESSIPKIPPIEVSTPTIESKKLSQEITQYTVQNGDTLQKISKKIFGSYSKWPKIYEANKDKLKSPNSIKPGQVINIPQD